MYTTSNLGAKDATNHRPCNVVERTLPLCSSASVVTKCVHLHCLFSPESQLFQQINWKCCNGEIGVSLGSWNEYNEKSMDTKERIIKRYHWYTRYIVTGNFKLFCQQYFMHFFPIPLCNGHVNKCTIYYIVFDEDKSVIMSGESNNAFIHP